MNIVERAKNIILKPKDEWTIIDQETTGIPSLIVTYLIPLALIPTIAAFVGYGVIGANILGPSLNLGIKQAIVTFVTTFLGVCISAYTINYLAPNFGSIKDLRKAMQLVIYSYTPVMLAGVFHAIPALGILSIVGVYGLYLLYVGIQPMMKTSDDKITAYFVVSLLVIIAIYAILATILAIVFIGRNYGAIPVMQ